MKLRHKNIEITLSPGNMDYRTDYSFTIDNNTYKGVIDVTDEVNKIVDKILEQKRKEAQNEI